MVTVVANDRRLYYIAVMKTELAIDGMSCNHCVGVVKKALETMDGVREAQVSVGHAQVTTEQPLDLNKVRTVLEDLGFSLK